MNFFFKYLFVFFPNLANFFKWFKIVVIYDFVFKNRIIMMIIVIMIVIIFLKEKTFTNKQSCCVDGGA